MANLYSILNQHSRRFKGAWEKGGRAYLYLLARVPNSAYTQYILPRKTNFPEHNTHRE